MKTPSPTVLFVEMNEDGTTGGSHRALFDLVSGLAPEGFAPVVAFYQDNPWTKRLEALGIPVVCLNERRGMEEGRPPPAFRVGRLPHLLTDVRFRVELLRTLGADLVFLNNSHRVGLEHWVPAGRLTGVPVVTSVRGDVADPVRFWRWPLIRGLHGILPVSPWIESGLGEQGVPKSLIHRLQDGVDVEHIIRQGSGAGPGVRAELGLAQEDLHAVMVGNLREWKGQHVALRALSHVPEDRRLKLSLVGAAGAEDAPYLGHLTELSRELGLDSRIRFLGKRDDVPALLDSADLAIHASTCPEPFGLVVAEAMAAGLPVVASKLGAPPAILGRDAGLLHDPFHPAELGSHLLALADSPGLRAELGTRAARRAREHFDISATRRRAAHIFRRILQDRPRRASGP